MAEFYSRQVIMYIVAPLPILNHIPFVMLPKRKLPEFLTSGQPSKRPRIGDRNHAGLSSRVVIEDLTKRNKRRKTPIGRHYTPGSRQPGPLVSVDRDVRGAWTLLSTSSPSNVTAEQPSMDFDDFPNIVFEDTFPPQRNRQVSITTNEQRY